MTSVCPILTIPNTAADRRTFKTLENLKNAGERVAEIRTTITSATYTPRVCKKVVSDPVVTPSIKPEIPVDVFFTSSGLG
jgi:hypothetical protein